MELNPLKQRFEELVASTGIPLASLTPQAGLDLMLRFYSDDPNGDSMTYFWGCVTCHGDEEVGINITRLIEDPCSQTMHLALLFKFGPRAVAGDFPERMKWCIDPADLATFRSAIEESPSFKVWGQSLATGVVIDSGDPWALFDCWGVRDPSRPIVSMSEEEWLRSDDVALMLRWFRQEWRGEEADLNRLLQRYCLACCRKIWQLLPHEASRAGVEVAERFLEGLATRDEFGKAEWQAEGAALLIGFNSDPKEVSSLKARAAVDNYDINSDFDAIARWAEEIARIPPEELAAMIHSPRPEDDLSPLGLLVHAAHFVDTAMCYPGIRPKESIEDYRLFLPTPLLREIVGNPFRAASSPLD
jgi:hypothetical protein